jgi:hypothetical protein
MMKMLPLVCVLGVLALALAATLIGWLRRRQ